MQPPLPAPPSRRARRVALVFLTLAAGLALACGVPVEGPEAPPADGRGEGPGRREQRLALSPKEELALGRQAYAEILSKSRVLPASRPEVRKVRQIGERIAEASRIEPLQREINLRIRGYTFEWEFNVLEDKRVNAFCLPAGKVAVFTGLLPVTESDAQLATVMSHEIAHALAHHASERVAREGMEESARLAASGKFDELDDATRDRLVGSLAQGASVQTRAYERSRSRKRTTSACSS